MRYSNKLPSILFLLMFTASAVFSQDFSSGFSEGESDGTGGGGFSEDFGDSSGENPDSSFGDFSAVSGDTSASPALNIGGEIKFQTRYYTDVDSSERIEDMDIESFPEVKLKLDYSGENSEFKANLVFSQDRMFSEYEDVIDEAFLRVYYDKFNIETGFMKVVWGKGDELKAVDILNPINYSDFYNKDLLERKIASPMFKVNHYVGLNGLLELVYIPYTSYPEFDSASDGRWAPYDTLTLSSLAAAGTTVSYKNNRTLYSSQAALRYTNSSNGFDYGLIYSYGFMPLPTTKLDSFTGTGYGSADIKPERANIFGLEAAKVLFSLNSRAEFAYYMSSDIKGDDPDIQNNKIMWVFGFDKDLPVSSFNLLIETQGLYTLNNREIEASHTDRDVDYDEDDTFSRNIIIARLKDSLNHDRIRPELSFTYHFEDQDFMIRPETEFVLKDDISFDILYTYFYGDNDTPFGAYNNNSFLQAKFVYSF